jgi:hypothetical protein
MGIDPKLYFCDNLRTKEGPRPIGFLDREAPACALFESSEFSGPPTMILIVPAPAQQQREDLVAGIELKALRGALTLATIGGLGSWLFGHLPAPMIAALKTWMGF